MAGIAEVVFGVIEFFPVTVKAELVQVSVPGYHCRVVFNPLGPVPVLGTVGGRQVHHHKKCNHQENSYNIFPVQQ